MMHKHSSASEQRRRPPAGSLLDRLQRTRREVILAVILTLAAGIALIVNYAL